MICPNCGQETDDNNRFCIKCGAPTAQAGPPAAPPPPGAAPPPPPGMEPPPPPAVAAPPPPVVAPPPPGGVTQQPAPQGGVQYAPQGAQPQQPAQPQYTPAPFPPVPPAGAGGGYGQQTIQMPAQQPGQYPPQGAYQQPVYGQVPYAPAPGQQYAPVQPGMQGYPQPYAGAAAKAGGSTITGILTIVAGGIIVGSTFVPWLTVMGLSVSGWQIMRQGVTGSGGSGMSLVITGGGTVFFTGFFTLVLGALILASGLMMLFRRRVGGILAFVFALPAAGFAAVNIVMVYTKMQSVSPGAGLWMFAAGSAVAIVLGIIGLASSGA